MTQDSHRGPVVPAGVGLGCGGGAREVLGGVGVRCTLGSVRSPAACLWGVACLLPPSFSWGRGVPSLTDGAVAQLLPGRVLGVRLALPAHPSPSAPAERTSSPAVAEAFPLDRAAELLDSGGRLRCAAGALFFLGVLRPQR